MEKIISFTDWHAYDPRTGPGVPVITMKGIWLVFNVTVLISDTNGKNTLVGPGSLVTNSLPANVMLTRIPAKVLKQIDTGKSGFNQ